MGICEFKISPGWMKRYSIHGVNQCRFRQAATTPCMRMDGGYLRMRAHTALCGVVRQYANMCSLLFGLAQLDVAVRSATWPRARPASSQCQTAEIDEGRYSSASCTKARHRSQQLALKSDRGLDTACRCHVRGSSSVVEGGIGRLRQPCPRYAIPCSLQPKRTLNCIYAQLKRLP